MPVPVRDRGPVSYPTDNDDFRVLNLHHDWAILKIRFLLAWFLYVGADFHRLAGSVAFKAILYYGGSSIASPLPVVQQALRTATVPGNLRCQDQGRGWEPGSTNV